jgi:hypothetical protein
MGLPRKILMGICERWGGGGGGGGGGGEDLTIMAAIKISQHSSQASSFVPSLCMRCIEIRLVYPHL